MSHIKLLLFGLLFSTNVWATGTLTMSGASGYSNINSLTNNTAPIIYGGISGAVGTPPADNVTANDTCVNNSTTNSTCTGNGDSVHLCTCNRTRVYPNQLLTIGTTRSSDAPAGKIYALFQTSGGTTLNHFTSAAAGDSSVQIKWSDICAAAGFPGCVIGAATTYLQSLTVTVFVDTANAGSGNAAVPSGAPSFNVTITVMGANNADSVLVPGNANGINGFFPYPGDGKVTMEQLTANGSFPTLPDNDQAQKMRVEIASTSLQKAVPDDSAVSEDDLIISSGSSTSSVGLDSSRIDSLDNDHLYFFRVALLDHANNVMQFYPPYNLTNLNPAWETSCNTSPSTACPFAATPEQVLGLLDKDINCFIATAAFGSSWGPQLKAFRQFRHNYLLTSKIGRQFVTKYYKYGPIAARFIYDKPALRFLSRGMLWPVYVFADLANDFGLVWASVCAMMALMALALLIMAVFQAWTRNENSMA